MWHKIRQSDYKYTMIDSSVTVIRDYKGIWLQVYGDKQFSDCHTVIDCSVTVIQDYKGTWQQVYLTLIDCSVNVMNKYAAVCLFPQGPRDVVYYSTEVFKWTDHLGKEHIYQWII